MTLSLCEIALQRLISCETAGIITKYNFFLGFQMHVPSVSEIYLSSGQCIINPGENYGVGSLGNPAYTQKTQILSLFEESFLP